MKEVISSLQNSRVKSLRKLYSKKKRRQKGKFVLEGFRIIEEALNAEADFDSIFMTPEFYSSPEGQVIREHSGWHGSDVFQELLTVVDEKVLSRVADTSSPQGIIAVVNEIENSVDELFNNSIGRHGALLLLDRIQDPGNMGTIIRTAVAAGIDGIILLKGSVDVYNLKVLRATMGAIFNIPIIKDITFGEFLDICPAEYKLVAADLSADIYYNQLEYSWPFVIAIGNEANGLQDKIINKADYLIKIPIRGSIDSLNAAMAAGIIVYSAMDKKW